MTFLRRFTIYQWTALILGVLAIIGGQAVGYAQTVPQLFLASALAVCMDFGVGRWRMLPVRFPWSGLITGMIIAMVLPPHIVWWHVLLVVGFGMGSKYLIQYKHKNIFNPAAFGLCVGLLLLHIQMGWWAANDPVLTIILGSLLLVKLPGRWKLIWMYLAVTLACIGIRSIAYNISVVDQVYLIIGTAFYFLFFILTDPKTSPLRSWAMLLFAATAAGVSFALFLLFPSSIFLVGLLVANLCTPVFAKMHKRAAIPSA